MALIRIKRGTRSQLDAAKAANQLAAGEPYLVTDEAALAIGTAAGTYADISGGAGVAVPSLPSLSAVDPADLGLAWDTSGSQLAATPLGRLPLLSLPVLSSTPTAPGAGDVVLFARDRAGVPMLRSRQAGGHIWRYRPRGEWAAEFNAAPGSALLTGHTGLLFAATGTATATTPANTSRYTRSPRVEALVTAAATTAVAGLRVAAAPVFTGTGTVDGGFLMIMRGGPATGVATTTSRFFMGVRNSTAAPTDVEPSSLTNIVGIGYDAADTTIQFFTRGAGAVVKTSSGIAVPTTDRAALFELILWCPPGATQECHMVLTDMINDTVATKDETTVGNLPASNLAMTPHINSSVGGTSSVIGVALHSAYLTTDFY